MKPLIFWMSYLWVPFAIAACWFFWKDHGRRRWFSIAALVLSLPLAWARFVEPRILLVAEESIDLSGDQIGTNTIKIALFSDTHYGVFPNAMPMKRIVKRINKLDVDAVFIAGDFLYELPKAKVQKAVAALGDVHPPVFAVMGNHDVGFPGPQYGFSLYQALQQQRVTLVENRAVEAQLNGTRVIVSGASDLWQGQQSFRFSADLPEDVPVLLLVHNPDTAARVPREFEYDLMLAGHTHGGQIRLPIPGFTQRVIPTDHPFDTGLHDYKGRKVYVTPGTGMVGIPMRFRRPPRIDVLTLTLPPED